MNLLLLFLMMIIGGIGVLICYKKFSISGAYIFAIGGAVSANIFNIGNYPISVGNMVFGIDSVIYTVFIFCVILIHCEHGKKESMSLTYSSMASIIYAGIIQFIADWATKGLSYNIVVWDLFSFFFSAIATWLAIYFTLKLFDFFKSRKVNIFINLFLSMLLASIVDSLVYFGLIAIFNQGFDNNFSGVLMASYIGKIATMVVMMAIFYLIKRKRKEVPNEK